MRRTLPIAAGRLIGGRSPGLALFAAAAQGALDWAASLSDERSQGVSVLRPGDRFGNYNPDADGWRLQSAHLRAADPSIETDDDERAVRARVVREALAGTG